MEEIPCSIFEIWEDYREALHAFILKRVQDDELAKDIIQDVLLKSYQFCASGKSVAYIKSWLYKIALNTIVDHSRNAGREITTSDFLSEDSTDDHVVGEASAYIKSLIRLLPDEYAIPLTLHDLEDLSQKEIARQLNLSLTNTKSRIIRARIKLKALFMEYSEVTFNTRGEMTSFAIKPHYQTLEAGKQ